MCEVREDQGALMSEGEQKLRKKVESLSTQVAQADREWSQVQEHTLCGSAVRAASDKAARMQSIRDNNAIQEALHGQNLVWT